MFTSDAGFQQEVSYLCGNMRYPMVISFSTDMLCLRHISCSNIFNHGYDVSLLHYAYFPFPSFCVRLLNYSLNGIGLPMRRRAAYYYWKYNFIFKHIPTLPLNIFRCLSNENATAVIHL